MAETSGTLMEEKDYNGLINAALLALFGQNSIAPLASIVASVTTSVSRLADRVTELEAEFGRRIENDLVSAPFATSDGQVITDNNGNEILFSFDAGNAIIDVSERLAEVKSQVDEIEASYLQVD